jgi:hypothetical protein
MARNQHKDDCGGFIETNVSHAANLRKSYPSDGEVKAPAKPETKCKRCEGWLREDRGDVPDFIKSWGGIKGRPKGYGDKIWPKYCTNCAYVLYSEDAKNAYWGEELKDHES